MKTSPLLSLQTPAGRSESHLGNIPRATGQNRGIPPNLQSDSVGGKKKKNIYI